MVKVNLKDGKVDIYGDVAVVSYSKLFGFVYVTNKYTKEEIKTYEADKVCCVEFE